MFQSRVQYNPADDYYPPPKCCIVRSFLPAENNKHFLMSFPLSREEEGGREGEGRL